MTEQELAKIFNETVKEVLTDFDISALERELEQRFGATQLSGADAEKISAVLAVVMQLNQKFLFRVLARVLCTPRQSP